MQTNGQLQAIKNIAIDACKRNGEQEVLAVSGYILLDCHDKIEMIVLCPQRDSTTSSRKVEC